jgi:hypothetical protein
MDITPAEKCDKSFYFTPTLRPFFLFLFALPHCAASLLLFDPPSTLAGPSPSPSRPLQQPLLQPGLRCVGLAYRLQA